jgi:hypothetical protein
MECLKWSAVRNRVDFSNSVHFEMKASDLSGIRFGCAGSQVEFELEDLGGRLQRAGKTWYRGSTWCYRVNRVRARPKRAGLVAASALGYIAQSNCGCRYHRVNYF